MNRLMFNACERTISISVTHTPPPPFLHSIHKNSFFLLLKKTHIMRLDNQK